MWPNIQSRSTSSAAPHRRYLPEPAAIWTRSATLSDFLFVGEPEACRRNATQFLPVFGHLALFLWIFHIFHIEARAFSLLFGIALAALPIHYSLHYRWKKPFFIAVSILGLGAIFGTWVTLYVLGFSTLLIGACYLPVRWAARAAVVAAIGIVCTLLRPAGVATSIPSNVWPVLATMFMFRIMIYLYEIKHAKKSETVTDTIGYFFLLPNYCFPLFPVVDYRTLQRGYFARDIHAIQRAGIRLIFKGTTHLLLYRLIYNELLIKPEEVRGPVDLLVYLFCNYLLYLRVSGQFHIACGMLHLFGYQLPETHKNYLLATGFTDYWRRINIYWKDFMVRLVFNPVVFRLKRWPLSVALAAGTAVVFFMTWLLHGYQSYWLRGSWGFTVPDALFWGILGLLVMINVQIDARRCPAKTREAQTNPYSLAVLIPRSLKTMGTLLTIAVLWSLWSSPSLHQWYELFSRGLNPRI